MRVARGRAWWVRHRVLRRGVTIGVAGVALSLFATAVSNAHEAQQTWGTTATVAVVERDVAAGGALGPDDVRLVSRPLAFLPADAVTEPVQEIDVATRDLRAGDVLTVRDLGSATGALELDEGYRAVSVPRESRMPPVVPGDRVDLYILTGDTGLGDELVSRRLDAVVSVIEVSDDAVTLAVVERDVAIVLTANSLGRVLIAVH